MEPNEDYITVKLDDDWADTITLDTSWLAEDQWNKWNKENKYTSGTITLTGDDADVIIDGMSLRKTLQGLNDRLAILHVNPELEAEFDELHALAEQYRALERKLLEKKAVWDALNGS
jgi:hypothetical protein